jgi:hypothetical protein
MSFPPDTIFIRASGPLTTEVDGELVMLDIDSGNYFNLDSIGTAIWGLLESPVRFGDLCQDLHTRYDAPLETIHADVATLLSRMLEHRLVRTEMP